MMSGFFSGRVEVSANIIIPILVIAFSNLKNNIKLLKIIDMIVLLISAVVTGFLGRYVAKEKGREAAEGFILGFLFSLIGVIVEAVLPSKK